MSEERAIRINKVLRELNISLDRAVEYLKDKGHVIESSPNAKISNEEYNALFNQFSADKGKKAASLEVSEEKRKEKEALRVEREKEIEDKRKQDEEKQRQEVIKAKATLSGPVAVGKIDLGAKKAEAPSATPPKEEPKAPVEEPKVQPEAPKAETPKPEAPKTEAPKVEAAPVAEAPKAEKPAAPVQKQEPVAEPKAAVEKPAAPEAKIQPEAPQAAPASPEDEKIKTQYQKLSGTTFTGQTIDLSQFNKPKKKKEEFKKDGAKPGTPGANQQGGANHDKNKRKRDRKSVV